MSVTEEESVQKFGKPGTLELSFINDDRKGVRCTFCAKTADRLRKVVADHDIPLATGGGGFTDRYRVNEDLAQKLASDENIPVALRSLLSITEEISLGQREMKHGDTFTIWCRASFPTEIKTGFIFQLAEENKLTQAELAKIMRDLFHQEILTRKDHSVSERKAQLSKARAFLSHFIDTMGANIPLSSANELGFRIIEGSQKERTTLQEVKIRDTVLMKRDGEKFVDQGYITVVLEPKYILGTDLKDMEAIVESYAAHLGTNGILLNPRIPTLADRPDIAVDDYFSRGMHCLTIPKNNEAANMERVVQALADQGAEGGFKVAHTEKIDPLMAELALELYRAMPIAYPELKAKTTPGPVSARE